MRLRVTFFSGAGACVSGSLAIISRFCSVLFFLGARRPACQGTGQRYTAATCQGQRSGTPRRACAGVRLAHLRPPKRACTCIPILFDVFVLFLILFSGPGLALREWSATENSCAFEALPGLPQPSTSADAGALCPVPIHARNSTPMLPPATLTQKRPGRQPRPPKKQL